MAYVTPTNRSTGDLITSAIWNQDVVENIKQNATEKATAAGLVYANGAESLALLAASGNGSKFLRFNSGATAVEAASVGLTSMIDDLLNSKALLALLDGGVWSMPSSPQPIGIGLDARFDGSASLSAADLRGGGFNLVTGGTGDSMALAVSTDAKLVAYADRNPYFACRLTSRATSAALKVQAWGFHASFDASTWTSTTAHKAFFRSVTTGALFAVTGNGSNEETTSLGASHTLGNAGVFEVYTTDDGVTWLFKIAGATVATHTTQVPTVTTGMVVVVGIENNTTTNLSITNCDLVIAYCDRT